MHSRAHEDPRLQIFIVLKKKDKQASFLHVYHHAGMFAVGWFATKYLPGEYRPSIALQM
jgi:hypothetical protein